MWWNDIATWEAKKLRTNYIIWAVVYAALSVLAPIIVVGTRYKLFYKASEYRLTGLGLILAIIVAIITIRFLVKLINKMPEVTHKEMCIKFGFKAAYKIIVIVALIGLGYAIKSNFEYALVTMNICCIFWCGALIVDAATLQILEKEYEYRKLAKERREVDKRMSIVK